MERDIEVTKNFDCWDVTEQKGQREEIEWQAEFAYLQRIKSQNSPFKGSLNFVTFLLRENVFNHSLPLCSLVAYLAKQ